MKHLWNKAKLPVLVTAIFVSLVGGTVWAVAPMVQAQLTNNNISSAPVAKPVEPAPVKPLTKDEVYTLLNQEREKAGLADLTVNPLLEQSACGKATDMLAKNYWSHVAPDGTQPWYFFQQAGYSYLSAGENLAYGFDDSQDLVSNWMSSPKHKENIVGSYNQFGLCILNDVNYMNKEHTNIIVNHFAVPQ